MNLDKIRTALKTLTPRECEVMNHVVAGLLNKQIASELGITERTVKEHRARVIAKMGAKSSAELITMLLTIQLNGKHQEVNPRSAMSSENADALRIMAEVLQTTPEAFLEHLIFWHCQREIEMRGIEYLAETLHSWIYPTKAVAQRAADKFEEVTVAANLESKVGGEFLYSCEVRPLLAVPTDESASELVIKGWKVHVEQCAGKDYNSVLSL